MRLAIMFLSVLVLAGCFGRGRVNTEIIGNVVVVGPSEEAVRNCAEYVAREDVPNTENGQVPSDRDANRYTRRLEDGYQLCRDTLLEADRTAREQRQRAQELNRPQR